MQSILDQAVTRLPGVSATVIVSGVGTWSGVAGKATTTTPMQTSSQFNIGSITKTVIAAQVMRLIEQGRLKLSDLVADDLPPAISFDTNGTTIEDLLSMRSGIPDLPESVGPDPLRTWQPQEVLNLVPGYRSAPGIRFDYSNTNYFLLGLVIAQATGTSLAAALRTDVLADPRLSTMVYQPEERPLGPLTLPSDRTDNGDLGGGYLASLADATAAGGAGAIASNAGSVALWGYQLFGGTMLSEQSLAAMTTFDSARYGLGVFNQTELGSGFDVTAIGNGGWDPYGYSTELTILPVKGVAIAVMTNESGDPVSLVIPIAQKLAALL